MARPDDRSPLHPEHYSIAAPFLLSPGEMIARLCALLQSAHPALVSLVYIFCLCIPFQSLYIYKYTQVTSSPYSIRKKQIILVPDSTNFQKNMTISPMKRAFQMIIRDRMRDILNQIKRRSSVIFFFKYLRASLI